MTSWQHPHRQPGILLSPEDVDLLIEPSAPHHWMSAAYARILAASAGLAWLGAASSELYEQRLEAASAPAIRPNIIAGNWRESFYPGHEQLAEVGCGAGNPMARIILVGKRDGDGRPPFYSRSGIWLLRALRLLGWDELAIYVTNAEQLDGQVRKEQLKGLEAAFAVERPVWVALGRAAAKALRHLRIAHKPAPHPGWFMKYRAKEGYQGYATLLEAAGVPGGMHMHRRKLPAPEGDGRSRWADRYGLPESSAYRRQATGDDPKATINTTKFEKARRDYVTGKLVTLRACADAHGHDYSRLIQVSRQQQWGAERDEYQRSERESVYAKTRELEASAQADIRKLLWASSVKAASKVYKLITDQDSDYTPSVSELATLVRISKEMIDVGDLDAGDRKKRAAEMSIMELAEQLHQTVDEQWGGAKRNREAAVVGATAGGGGRPGQLGEAEQHADGEDDYDEWDELSSTDSAADLAGGEGA